MDEEGVDFADQQKIIERLSDTGYTHFRVPGEVAESRIGNGGKENGTAKQIGGGNRKFVSLQERRATTEANLIHQLAAEEPSTARRILDSIKSFLKKLVGIDGEWKSDTQRVVEMLEDALKDAHGQSAENGNRYSLIEYETDQILNDREYSGVQSQWDAYQRGGLKDPIIRDNGGIVVVIDDSIVYTDNNGKA